MRRIPRYILAALLAPTSLAVIAINYLNALNIPDSLVLKLYLYGLGQLGLATSAGLVYEARTGRRVDGTAIGGCLLILSGVAETMLYRQDPVWGAVPNPVAEYCLNGAQVIVGIALLVSSLRTKKR